MVTPIKPWYVLDIDVSRAVREDFDFAHMIKMAEDAAPAPFHIWQQHDRTIDQLFTTSWLEHMKSIGLPVRSALLFWRRQGYQHPNMHIDMSVRPDGKLGIALNWCIGPDDADMVWYENTDEPGSIGLTETKSKYKEWPANTGTEISRRCIGSTCTMVQIDIPHNVIMKSHPRMLISARIEHYPDNWEQAVNLVQKLIKE